MSSLLEQLENNEAVLLMYLAGELGTEDRAEVEQTLAAEPGLRAELEKLRNDEQAFAVALKCADQQPLPVAETVALRQVSRMMAHWQAERLAERARATAARRGLRYPWWVYPLASAAAILVAFLGWWGNTDTPPEIQEPFEMVAFGEPEDNVAPLGPLEAQQVAEHLDQSFDITHAVLWDFSHSPDLYDAERHLLALSDGDDDELDIFPKDWVE